jgi:DNA-binding response OmpR family regulator
MARILAVHDQSYVTWIVACFLTQQGHEVVRSSHADMALYLLRTRRFDLLITEANLCPLHLLTAAEQEEILSRLAGVIVLTSRWEYAHRRGRLGETTVYVLPRPFSPSELARLVREVASNSPVEFAT